MVWPAVTLLLPLGITFAAARVYAEAAPAPEACDAAAVVECADAAVGSVCHSCSSGTCACFSGGCMSGGTLDPNALACRNIEKCESFKQDSHCKAAGDTCMFAEDGAGKCVAATCLPSDGGPAATANFFACAPDDGPRDTSSGDLISGSTSGTFIPGPPTVPGSSGASSTPASSDDSGCATSPGTTLPLLGAPLAIGLLFALRRKKKR
jgi:MYXO-CTERM domain-containing protein